MANNSLYNNVREIVPNDSHKSFYGKAYEAVDCDGNICLYSYNTHVAWINPNGECTVRGLYSKTTTRHIKAWLTAHNLPYSDSHDILKRYGFGMYH